MMKTSGISALAVALTLGLMTPADAEDWSGLHLTFGLSRASTDMFQEVFVTSRTLEFSDAGPYAAVGYDWSNGNLVFGLVGDLDLSGAPESDLVTSGKGVTPDMDWFASVRGRVGTTVTEDVLLYVTGGVAFARVDANLRDFTGTVTGTESDKLQGTALGIGMEYALAPGRHLTLEVMQMDFGSSKRLFETSIVGGRVEPEVQTVRLGYTWRF